jgi:hypothetical protein
MSKVPSRTFCCCVPSRFGVAIGSIVTLAFGGVLAGLGWALVAVPGSNWLVSFYCHKKLTLLLEKFNNISFSGRQEATLIVLSVLYTILAIFSLLG